MGGDNFKKSSSENPHIEFSRGDTILSRLNNEWELAKIRHDAAAEYFDELCEMVEFEINTHHNNRNYFMFIEIEFPVNLNQFVPRSRHEEIDFLMQKTWSDKFQEFMREQEINCHLIKSNNQNNNILEMDYTAKEITDNKHLTGRWCTFTYDLDSLNFNGAKLNSDYLMSEFNHKKGQFMNKINANKVHAITLERSLESVNGNYITSLFRSAIRLNFHYRNSVLTLSAMLNCSLRIESLPEGYFFGLTENEKDSTNIQKRNNNRTKRFLLTWPKHVFVENKSLKNDFRENGRSW